MLRCEQLQPAVGLRSPPTKQWPRRLWSSSSVRGCPRARPLGRRRRRWPPTRRSRRFVASILVPLPHRRFPLASTVRRCTRRVRANASTEESSRCCRPQISRPRAAWVPSIASADAPRGARRYWSSSLDRRSSGASSGRPLDVIPGPACAWGSQPATSRRSSFRRRTMTSSRSFGATGTPREKRCGSRISSSAEKLFECPLCGVAERKSRCSNAAPGRGQPG